MPITRAKIDLLHVCCYKWGGYYSSEDVNVLRAMVGRNLSVPHNFYCITDDPAGLDGDIIVRPLLDAGIPDNGRKLRTFSRDFLGLEGQYVVSLDIDLVIVDSIDFLADLPEKDFVIARHRHIARGGVRGHGAVYRLKVGTRDFVWEMLAADPGSAAAKFPGSIAAISEQRWLDSQLEEMDFFPEGKIVSFSHDCNARGFQLFGRRGARLGLTTAHFGVASPPEGAAIISFHGPTLPRHVRDGRHGRWRRAPFVAEYWHK